MALDVVVPALGESITEATVLGWRKSVGDAVAKDEILVEVETDKVSVEIPAETAGVLAEILAEEGQDVEVGAVLARIDTEASAPAAETAPAAPPPAAETPEPAPAAPEPPPPAAPAPGPEPAPAPAPAAAPPAPAPAAAPAPGAAASGELPSPVSVRRSGAGGKITDSDLREFLEHGDDPLSPAARRAMAEGGAPAAPAPAGNSAAPAAAPAAPPSPEAAPTEARPDPAPPAADGGRTRRVPMSRLRRRIGERLKEAQDTAAMLTTFNEVDMTRVMALRKAHGPDFEARHGIRLGFMSFFVKACISALRAFPTVNAEIDGGDIVYKDHYDIGVAVGSGRGLVVPVIRDADRLGFSGIEHAIADVAARANDGTLKAEDLEGGTFTISNGGIYGSMLSTPILNAPQSGILGVHRIQDRPVADSGVVVIRPMMYLALSYDHRLVDGREAVSFLVRVREALEQPGQLALDV